jgi:hypothetical protein
VASRAPAPIPKQTEHPRVHQVFDMNISKS